MHSNNWNFSKRGFGNNNRGLNQNHSNQGSRYGGGQRGSGRRQSTFDPTNVILQSELTQNQVVEIDEYQTTHDFIDFNITHELKSNIQKRGYIKPTPIQDQVIPHILEGSDVVGIANTGTGKTAAFLIPLIDRVLKNSQEKVLIITPTRELALQVRDEIKLFTANLKIFTTLCIGGASMYRQIESLQRGSHFVIGTPGRIKDLNQRRKLNFNHFSNIVLDEVDRMLDMGFIHDVKHIISLLPKNRSSLFFSATMTDRVKEVMREFLTDPVYVSVKTQEAAHNVTQEVVKISGRSKVDVLHNLLIQDSFQKVLVFGRTKHGADRLVRSLEERGIRVSAIHGNKSQGQRERSLNKFKNNFVQVLIATDVVARGVDIKDITHVINYDLPESYENYIHRIGRTGRAGSTGIALTFVD